MPDEIQVPNLPDVKIIKDGKEVDTSAIDDYDPFMSFLMQASIAANTVKIRKQLESERILGSPVQTVLNCDDTPRVLDVKNDYLRPLAVASFSNDGPDTAYISINSLNNWQDLRNGETYTIDLIKADKRIETIWYRCNQGEVASIRVNGVL